MKAKQKGFGALAVIAILVVISGLGLIGWYVYNSGKDAKTTTDSSSVKSETKTSQKESSSVTESKEAKPVYKEVPELGVKIRLTDETKDLIAEVSSSTVAGFSLQSFVDATENADVVRASDGTSACANRVSVKLYKSDEQKLLENDQIQAFKFDADGKPLDGQGLVRLADKRYARFSGSQATCIKYGSDGAEALQKRESEVRGLLLKSLPENISSL